SELSSDRVRAAPRVGAGPAGAVRADAHRAHRTRAPFPLRPLDDGVAEAAESVARLPRDPSLDLQLARRVRVRPERIGEAPRGETTQPTPGTTGESTLGSLGVAEKPLPASSTTAT